MSRLETYRPERFQVERSVALSSKLGQAILGASKLGTASSQWADVDFATFSLNADYSSDENGTLIYGAETATLSLSFLRTRGGVLYPGELIRATYGTTVLFIGIVDSTSIAISFEGGIKRYDFSATIASAYAVMMSKTVSWKKLPAESAIDRVRRWVNVQNWTG